MSKGGKNYSNEEERVTQRDEKGKYKVGEKEIEKSFIRTTRKLNFEKYTECSKVGSIHL